MKFVFLTTHPILPNISGYTIRLYYILKGLKKLGHNITLISLANEIEQQQEKDEKYDLICDKYIPIQFNNKGWIWRVIKAFFQGNSFKMAYFDKPEISKFIIEEMEKINPDIICGYTYITYIFLKYFLNKNIWIDFCDAISMLHRRHFKTTSSFFKKIFLLLEIPRVLKTEKECLKNCLYKTIISEVDKQYLMKYTKDNFISVIPNGTIVPECISNKYNPFEISYLGDMSYFQNIEAVDWFIKNVYPRLREIEPRIVFKIIGKNPSPKLINLTQQDPNIIVTGFVESVYDELASSCVLVCPIKISSGMQNKVLEAMSIGVPVIATSNIIKAITTQGGVIEQAESIDEWIKKILYFINNEHKRKNYSLKVRNFVIDNFSWDKQIHDLEKMFKELNNKTNKI